MFPDALMLSESYGPKWAPTESPSRPQHVLLAALICLTLTLFMTGVGPVTRRDLSGDPATRVIRLCASGRADLAVRTAGSALGNRNLSEYQRGLLLYLRGGALRVLREDDLATTDYDQAARLMTPFVRASARLSLESDAGHGPLAKTLALVLSYDDSPLNVNDGCWVLSVMDNGDPALAARRMAQMSSTLTDFRFLDTYAWALFRSGRRREAIASEKEALHLARLSASTQEPYYAACLRGMSGNDPQRAAAELRAVFARDITMTSAWDAARCLEKPTTAQAAATSSPVPGPIRS